MEKYSRQERTRRQLEKAANSCGKLTDYWPILQRIDAIIRENESLHSTIRILLERLSEKSKVPATIPHFLQALLASAERNCDKKRGGERYPPELVLFCLHLRMTSGPRQYIDLHLQLKGVIPSSSALTRKMKKSKDVPLQGEFRFQKLDDFITKRDLPRLVSDR